MVQNLRDVSGNATFVVMHDQLARPSARKIGSAHHWPNNTTH